MSKSSSNRIDPLFQVDDFKISCRSIRVVDSYEFEEPRLMKYTMTVIDSEEKFTEKFGIDPQWTISTPSNGLSQKQLHLSGSNLSFSTRLLKGS